MPKRHPNVIVNDNGLEADTPETETMVYKDLGRGDPFMFSEGSKDHTGDLRIKSQTKGFICPVTGTRYQQKDQKAPVVMAEVSIDWSPED